MKQDLKAKQRGTRLTLLRKMAGLTIADLSEKYKIGYSTITQWEHGRFSGISTKGAEKIIAIMQQEGVQATTSWLLHGEGSPPSLQHSVAASGKMENLITQEITRFEAYSAQHIVVEITDDAMSPIFSPGDFVGAVLSGSLTELNELVNQICIIQLTDHTLLVRKIIKEFDSTYSLFAYNSAAKSNQPLLITSANITHAGLVCRLWRASSSYMDSPVIARKISLMLKGN